MDGKGRRIEVCQPADLVPGVVAILVLEVAGKVLKDEPVHSPLCISRALSREVSGRMGTDRDRAHADATSDGCRSREKLRARKIGHDVRPRSCTCTTCLSQGAMPADLFQHRPSLPCLIPMLQPVQLIHFVRAT